MYEAVFLSLFLVVLEGVIRTSFRDAYGWEVHEGGLFLALMVAFFTMVYLLTMQAPPPHA